MYGRLSGNGKGEMFMKCVYYSQGSYESTRTKIFNKIQAKSCKGFVQQTGSEKSNFDRVKVRNRNFCQTEMIF